MFKREDMKCNIHKKYFVFAYLIFLFIFALSAEAVTVTWDGEGLDYLASNSYNWSNNTAPQYGDDVVFDGTSSKDCTWDLNVTLNALSNRAGYTGKITKISSVTLTIANNFVPPGVPSGLSASTISSSQIDLSWTDNSDNETGFKIERKIGAGGTYGQIADVEANVSAYSDTGLSSGTAYYYKVRAYNFVDNSAYSNEANATTLIQPPTVITDSATNVTHDFARINGRVNPNGNNTTAYFELGTDTTYDLFRSSDISVGSGTNNIIVWTDIAGFSPETTYHYRVVAFNGGGTSYGNDMPFTTLPLPGTIEINATLNGAPWTGAVSYTISGPETINGALAPATFTEKPVGQYTLSYNSGGPANAIFSSITPSATQMLQTEGTITFTLNFIYSPPTATTDDATNLNSISATLNATVNPHYFDTSVHFEWGLDTSYPNATTPVSMGSGGADVAVSAGITGLSPNTTYHYKVVAANDYGTTNGDDKTFTTPPITLAITSPLNSATINRPDVMVRGTVANSTGNETGVTVNGIVATIYNGQFFMNHVPLTEGSNTITVTATDTAGYTASISITVNAVTTMPYVTLNTNIESGMAPMTTYFSVSTSIPNSVSTYQIDYEGDSIIDYTGTTFDNISHTYTTEGIFYPTVTVTDTQNNAYSDTIAIVVLSTTQLDALLRVKWEAMKTALANQDVEVGVGYFDEKSREKYRDIFNALISRLPQIASGMADIQLIYMNNGIAKFRIRRNEIYGGQTYAITYYIYYKVGSDGIWRIESF